MEPRRTAVQAPIQLRIADDIRMQIERGEQAPGDSLPTLAEICEQWSCSMNSARGAMNLLKAQGLVDAGRGKAPRVRVPVRKVVRSSDRHQVEKDLAIRPESERAVIGEAETNLNMSIAEQKFSAHYDVIDASPELAEIFKVPSGEPLLRRRYEAHDSQTGHLLSYSVSHLPVALVRNNPAILDDNNEPWPGGTQHQLLTVGVEITRMVDEVTARMPTTVEAQAWGLAEGIPLLFCRRISYDLDGRVVEISDADYPADRTEFRFVTELKTWPKKRQAGSGTDRGN
ncbi:GntR family transcriptional regulator [Micromonospora sp. NPDC005215]|uniref:GntR family transcriptional regulator n=1 Tax=Micromonospora sp. NPDC005215 TaxID=3157024 RepID=UPI0033A1FB02